MRLGRLRRARSEVAVFAEEAGRPLAAFQAGALALEARTTCVVGPRQSGKSRGAAVVSAWWAFTRPGSLVLIVSASEEGALRLLGAVRDLATGSPLLSASVVDDQARLVRLSNGSRVVCVAASERAVRGWSTDLLVLDECQSLPESVFDAALPTTAARPEARVLMLGTGGVPFGRWYDAVNAGLDSGSPQVRAFSWRLRDAKWISRGHLEQARLMLPPQVFEAEYGNRFAGAADAMFPADLLARQSADLDLPSLSALRGPARLLGGVDWGEVNDRTAVVAIARVPASAWNPEGRPPDEPTFVAWPARVFDAGAELSACVDEIVASPAEWSWLAVEKSGLGAMPAQEVRRRLLDRNARRREALHGEDEYHDVGGARVERVATQNDLKAAGYAAVRALLERGQLVLARDAQFMRELASLRVQLRQSGGAGIEASGSGHDDLPDALMLATVPHRRRPSGEVGVVLARAAAGRVLDAAAPGEPGAMTATGGGLVLPRRPPLQSVMGREVTRPPAGGRGWQDEADEQTSAMHPEVLAVVQAGRRALREAEAERRAGWGPGDD